ncbi:MAG TPA: GspE/PulE family protein [Candidatus Dormibacteraeota bacterium]|nr:GspE/PulE family protein [Candidatus Dormibacteraeota bacterium]
MVKLGREGAVPAVAGWRRLGDILLDQGAATPEAVKRALRRQRRDKRPIGELLVEEGVAEGLVIRAIGLQIGRTAIDVDDLVPDEDALAAIDAATARRLGVLPLRIDVTGRLHVASPSPADESITHALRELSRRETTQHLAGRGAVGRALDRHYPLFGQVGTAAEQAIVDRVETAQRAVTEVQVDAPIVRIVDLLLTQGLRDRASDIHLEPQSDRLRIRFRVDGALHDVQDLPLDLGIPIASRLKIMAGMDIVDRHRAQDGQIATRLDDRPIDIRVATMETIWGEKIVLRILDPERSLVSLPSLGLQPGAEATLRRLVTSPYGLIAVSGPTGSGKTTTLYSLLSELDRQSLNVTTIEDPVEYQFADINQVRINRLAEITFANGLRAILRQDPDVILVGEVRDAETAQIAIQAALTGHLVLCSLHASDTAGAIHRFLDMGIESFLVASALIGVVAQRLVRTNCDRCTGPYAPKPEEYEFYRSVRRHPPAAAIYAGQGCTRCAGTGFYGRTGVFESLRIDDDLRQLIVDKVTNINLRHAASIKGMQTLQQSSLDLVDRGITSIAEAMRAVYVI